ncbi:MAG TPA: zf-HC2 domain-containing protein [Thermoanaerobaculia bacterium]
MEHAEATETMAAERYLLGEMTPEDRDAFEEHFFGCAECAASVRDGEMIRAAIRTEKATRTRQPLRTGRGWLAAAAISVAIAGMTVIQNVALRQEIARVRVPHIGNSYSFLTAGSRGGQEQVVNAGDRPFTIDFDIAPQPDARRFVVEVVDGSGRVRAKDVVAAEAAGETQHLQFPGRSLQPGHYSLEVHAEPAGPPATAWSFVVR